MRWFKRAQNAALSQIEEMEMMLDILGDRSEYAVSGFAGFIYARSGLACKHGLRPANCVGVVDSDYRGEVMVALHNDSNVNRTVSHGERVAQMVIGPFIRPDFVEADDLSDTERGDGGFGHTGK